MMSVPVSVTLFRSTEPVNAMDPSCALTKPPPHGYSMTPLLDFSTGKSTHDGEDGVEPVTTSVGRQLPTSQSASTIPSQSSSRPLHISNSLGPVVQPLQVMVSSLQTSLSGPSHASPSPNPSSTLPSQSSSMPLHASRTGSIPPRQGPKVSSSRQTFVPSRQAPTWLPQTAGSPGSQ